MRSLFDNAPRAQAAFGGRAGVGGSGWNGRSAAAAPRVLRGGVCPQAIPTGAPVLRTRPGCGKGHGTPVAGKDLRARPVAP